MLVEARIVGYRPGPKKQGLVLSLHANGNNRYSVRRPDGERSYVRTSLTEPACCSVVRIGVRLIRNDREVVVIDILPLSNVRQIYLRTLYPFPGCVSAEIVRKALNLTYISRIYLKNDRLVLKFSSSVLFSIIRYRRLSGADKRFSKLSNGSV